MLGQSAAWLLVRLLFECPKPGWHAQVAALAKEVDDPVLRAAADAAQDQASEGLYHTVFGPGGPAAPREISYRRLLQPGQFLADLEAFYRAFAYAPDSVEPPDHVAVEAGFVAYLRLKESYALACGSEQPAMVTADAGRKFLQDHLAWIADPLAHMLAASGIDYLEAAARGCPCSARLSSVCQLARRRPPHSFQ